jgi:hypothetical protein
VRYPDLTTVPGYLDNPAEDETDLNYLLLRNIQRVSENTDPAEPLGRAPNNFESYGKIDYQKDKTGDMPVREKIDRIIFPYEPLRGTYPMTGWD